MGFSHSLTFLVGRCLTGLGIGMMMVASPCLMVELAPAELRGCLVGFFSLMVMAGKLCGYYMMLAMGPSISASMSSSSASSSFYDSWSYDWRTPVLVEACLGLLMIWVQWQLPESPRWDRHDQARHSIALLHEQPIDSPAVQQLWEQIGTYNRTTISYMDLLRSKKRTVIGAAGLVIADWLTGHATLVKYYAPAIFYASGLQEKDHPLTAVGCTSSLALAAAAISLGWCVDHFERKRLLLLGCVTMMLCHLGLGSVFHWATVVDWQTGTLMLAAPSVAITCVYLFIVAYAFTWGSLVLVTLCEWFGTTERAKGVALMMALVLATRWIQGTSAPWYFCMIGPSSMYFFFALALMVAACFVYRWIPNTTTRPLEAISC
jgi:MFS family permease